MITFAPKGIQALMLYNGSGRATVAEEWLASFQAGQGECSLTTSAGTFYLHYSEGFE